MLTGQVLLQVVGMLGVVNCDLAQQRAIDRAPELRLVPVLAQEFCQSRDATVPLLQHAQLLTKHALQPILLSCTTTPLSLHAQYQSLELLPKSMSNGPPFCPVLRDCILVGRVLQPPDTRPTCKIAPSRRCRLWVSLSSSCFCASNSSSRPRAYSSAHTHIMNKQILPRHNVWQSAAYLPAPSAPTFRL